MDPHRLHRHAAVAAAGQGVGDVHALVVHQRLDVQREIGAPHRPRVGLDMPEVLGIEGDGELVVGVVVLVAPGGPVEIAQRERHPARLRVRVVAVADRLDGQRDRPRGQVAGMEVDLVLQRAVEHVHVPMPVVVVGVDRPAGLARRGILIAGDRPRPVGQIPRLGQVVVARQIPLQVHELVHLRLRDRRGNLVVGDHQAHRVRIPPRIHRVVPGQRPGQRAVVGVGVVVGDADVEVHARGALRDRRARRHGARVA